MPRHCWMFAVLLAFGGWAEADDFDLGGGISGNYKNRLSEGFIWRVEKPDASLIYKDDLSPGLCGNTTLSNSCYSFDGDANANARLVRAPGAYGSANKDAGDLNYQQGSLVAALTKLSSDISLSYGNFVFKAGAIGYFDPSQFTFSERHPDTTFQPPRTLRPTATGNSIGRNWILKDLLVSTKFSVFDHDFTANVGYQHIRWGESTLVALNSLSEINAPDLRVLYQPGTQINEIFRPTPAVLLATPLVENLALDLTYLLDWEPVALPGGGTLFAPLNSLYRPNGNILLTLGQFHDDPNGMQRLPNVGRDLSDTSLNAQFLQNGGRPHHQGQFGGKLTWFAPDVNNGTEFGFYFLNYHSRLPIASVIAANHTCIKDTTDNLAQATVDCKGFKTIPTGLEPAPLDTAKLFLDYPSNIHMLGLSFNTNAGKWSLAGELSYRPNLPVQIAETDLVFAAIQPALPAHNIFLGTKSLQQLTVAGLEALGLDPVTAAQTLASQRTLNLVTTVVLNQPNNFYLPSRGDAAPDFVEHYRGYNGVQPNQVIPGYQRLQVLQFDLTGLRAIGSSENPIGADQIIFITELGFTSVLNMPARSRIQFEGGDFNDTHASPGADGTGGAPADGTSAAERLNPTRQTKGFASPFAAGYRIIARLEYDNLMFGWNFKPQIIWAHDVTGIAISPSQNFIAGTKNWQINTDVELSQDWTVQLFYQGWTGGGTVDGNRDKDFAGFSVNYAF